MLRLCVLFVSYRVYRTDIIAPVIAAVSRHSFPVRLELMLSVLP